MDNMYISGNTTPEVILCQTKCIIKINVRSPNNILTSWIQKKWCDKSAKYNFNRFETLNNFVFIIHVPITIGFSLFNFTTFGASLFNFLNYVVWQEITDTRNAHTMYGPYIVNQLRLKVVYISTETFLSALLTAEVSLPVDDWVP